MKTKLFSIALVAILSISSAFAHGVQLRWNIVSSTGAIRVWIEHWHGPATNVANFPLNVSYTVGGVTTTQTYYANGYANGTSVAGLPDGGSTSTLLSSCGGYNGANTQNNWVYWDFNPPACNTPVSLTIIAGPAVETMEACASLYPQTINSNFNDNSGPAMTCNDITVPPTGANCDAVVSNYNVTAVDACGGNVSLSYSIPEGSTFQTGTTAVVATGSDQYGNTSTCSFNVIVADNQPPTVLTQNTSVILNNGVAAITANDIDNGSFDGNTCGGVAGISVSPSSFDCNDLGSNQVVLTVTDISGNVSTGTATVTVIDTVPPVISCPGSITLNANPGECSTVVNFTEPAISDNCGGGVGDLASVLSNVNSNYTSLTSLVPSIYNFSDGVNGYYIGDGGNDMYDGGNRLNTSLATNIYYSDNNIISSTAFGTGGQYFTRKVNGLFVMAADVNNISSFSITGNNGADGWGNVDDAVLTYTSGNVAYRGFVKRVYNAGDPSINHLVIVEQPGNASHNYSTNTDDDYHIVNNLNAVSRIYYLLYASSNGGYVNNATTQQIMETFINDFVGGGPGTLTQIAGLPSGANYPLGTTTNTFVVSDASGNTNTCSFDVTVNQPAPLGIEAGDTVQVCAGDSAQLTPSLINPPSGAGQSNTSTTVCVFDSPGGQGNCNFGTSSLCNDGYQWITSTINSSPFSIAGVPSDINFEAFYTTCNTNAVFTFYVNGNSVGTYTPAYSCSCEPPTSSYPSAISFNSSQFSQYWNLNGNNTLGFSVNGTYVSGVRATVSFSSETYTWTGANVSDASASNPYVSPTTSGYYTVGYDAGNGCAASDSVFVKVNPLPTVALNSFGQVSLYGGQVALSGGSPSGGIYSGTGVSNNQLDPQVSGIGSHVITYTYTDANGCSNSDTASIEVIPCNIQLSGVVSNVSCPNGSDGSVDLTTSNTNGSVTYQWTAANGSTYSTEDIAGLTSGNYSVLVTDGNGCTQTASFSVVDNPDNTAPNAIAQNVTVQLDASGSGSTTAQAVDNGSSDACGIASTSIDVSSFDCSNVGANPVVLTVTDVNGNTSTATATITVEDNVAPNAIAQNVTVQLDANGNGSTTVAAVNNGSNDACGVASVDLSQKVFDCSHVGANTVTLTVLDVNGNTSTATATVNVIATPLVTSVSSPTFNGFNIACNGAATGSIDLTVSQGCAPYSYAWSNGATTEDISGLTAGTYSVTVTDASGTVTASESITLTEPSPLSATASSSGYLSGNGVSGTTLYLGYGPQSINLSSTASGGVAPYTYSWLPAGSLTGANTANPVASPTASTTYTVTATDANGCTFSTTVNVDVIDARCGKNLNKVLVCHKESKSIRGVVTTSYHNICVSANAVPAHLAHGDYLGPCVNSNKNDEGSVAEEDFDYHLYPNPTMGTFTVEMHSESASDAQFVLTDLQGRIINVIQETTGEGITHYDFDLSNYASGVYVLTITTGNTRHVERIVKQ